MRFTALPLYLAEMLMAHLFPAGWGHRRQKKGRFVQGRRAREGKEGGQTFSPTPAVKGRVKEKKHASSHTWIQTGNTARANRPDSTPLAHYSTYNFQVSFLTCNQQRDELQTWSGLISVTREPNNAILCRLHDSVAPAMSCRLEEGEA